MQHYATVLMYMYLRIVASVDGLPGICLHKQVYRYQNSL